MLFELSFFFKLCVSYITKIVLIKSNRTTQKYAVKVKVRVSRPRIVLFVSRTKRNASPVLRLVIFCARVLSQDTVKSRLGRVLIRMCRTHRLATRNRRIVDRCSADTARVQSRAESYTLKNTISACTTRLINTTVWYTYV